MIVINGLIVQFRKMAISRHPTIHIPIRVIFIVLIVLLVLEKNAFRFYLLILSCIYPKKTVQCVSKWYFIIFKNNIHYTSSNAKIPKWFPILLDKIQYLFTCLTFSVCTKRITQCKSISICKQKKVEHILSLMITIANHTK